MRCRSTCPQDIKPINEVAHTSVDDCVVFGCGDTAGTSVFGFSSHLLTTFHPDALPPINSSCMMLMSSSSHRVNPPTPE